ncbi:MAG: phosphoribosylanthranilate isomerase [Xanthomonadaceae bacterium]|nr:phosphoribosylanthranilate isomerase [Xanthomonadaceae bacterium]
MHVPHRTRIKFCGMTRVEDALAATALGVDAIGMIFAARSKRRVAPDAAAAIREALPPFVASVALFMDNPADEVHATIECVRPTLLQFHGGEDDAFCAAFGLPYLKAVAMGSGNGGDGNSGGEDPATLVARWPRAAAFLFDSHAKGEAGGSGRTFDWARVPAGFSRPFLVAGGLKPDNVFDAIRATGCWGVDVSSGIEGETPSETAGETAGVKDLARMRRFVAEVARADRR